ncbi:ubiquitin-conjugating enzyme E2 U isoform X2 [Ambystoma mexicanum]|uniref:ubiquitin-conjugating enzyme E2 U isoform X2 n=1 Tax=Ambystoma mexicanum TaxID=8296 RepID=UPI0037E74768
MHSRAYLLLEREYLELQEANLHGISATPISDSFLEWIAKVKGLKDSIWEVNDSSGKPCVDFLDNVEEWNKRYTMSSILLTIQAMLSNPILENAVNMEAVEMLKNEPAQYRKVVHECIRTSRELEAGVIEENANVERIQLLDDGSSHSPRRKIKSISFDDYHKTWSEIATSQARGDLKNSLLKDPTFQRDSSELKKKKNDETGPHEISRVVIRRVFTKPQRTKEKVNEKLERMNEMRQQYLAHNHPGECKPISQALATQSESSRSHNEEIWEKEVDNLVDWTNNLSTDILED